MVAVVDNMLNLCAHSLFWGAVMIARGPSGHKGEIPFVTRRVNYDPTPRGGLTGIDSNAVSDED